MKNCSECELATYCYSEANTWVFRTKQEMQEKQAEIRACPHYEKTRQGKSSQSPQQ